MAAKSDELVVSGGRRREQRSEQVGGYCARSIRVGRRMVGADLSGGEGGMAQSAGPKRREKPQDGRLRFGSWSLRGERSAGRSASLLRSLGVWHGWAGGGCKTSKCERKWASKDKGQGHRADPGRASEARQQMPARCWSVWQAARLASRRWTSLCTLQTSDGGVSPARAGRAARPGLCGRREHDDGCARRVKASQVRCRCRRPEWSLPAACQNPRPPPTMDQQRPRRRRRAVPKHAGPSLAQCAVPTTPSLLHASAAPASRRPRCARRSGATDGFTFTRTPACLLENAMDGCKGTNARHRKQPAAQPNTAPSAPEPRLVQAFGQPRCPRRNRCPARTLWLRLPTPLTKAASSASKPSPTPMPIAAAARDRRAPPGVLLIACINGKCPPSSIRRFAVDAAQRCFLPLRASSRERELTNGGHYAWNERDHACAHRAALFFCLLLLPGHPRFELRTLAGSLRNSCPLLSLGPRRSSSSSLPVSPASIYLSAAPAPALVNFDGAPLPSPTQSLRRPSLLPNNARSLLQKFYVDRLKIATQS
ncbi:hypothetical protein PSPO01_10796 [Paraphaeosphaeria sporulosa]